MLISNRPSDFYDDDASSKQPGGAGRVSGSAAEPPSPDPLKEAAPRDWKSRLLRGHPTAGDLQGRILPVLANALTALREAPELVGMLRFDAFALRPVVARTPPWGSPEPEAQWGDQEDRKLTELLERAGILVNVKTAGMAAQTVAMEHQFNPVADYLSALNWDGTERLDFWLHDYLDVDVDQYVLAVGARFFIQAAARALSEKPLKADCILILESDQQGTLKSTAAKTLFMPWFADYLPELSTKDAFIQLRGMWCIEIAELDSFSRATASKMKAFISSEIDRYRPPYGQHAMDFPRRTVFVGSTNQTEYLIDETGGRRFWPVKTGRIRIGALKRDRDQLWAEAVARYKAGEKWWIDDSEPEVLEAATGEQAARYKKGQWDAKIAEWLEAPRQRRDKHNKSVGEFTSTRESVTVSEILIHCIGKPLARWTRDDEMAIAKWLRHLGWKKRRAGSGEREWRYHRPSKGPVR